MSRKLRSIKAPLDDPELVKEYIANLECSEGHKGNLVNAYALYVSYYDIPFERPHYNRVDRISRIPRTEDIDKIISHAKLRYAVAFTILRDTGMRPIELTWLRVKDIDLESGRLYPGTAKHGSGRVLQLKPSTVVMVKRYLTQSRTLWPSRRRLTENWIRLRNSVATKLGEPRLKTIKLYDLRHHYATMLYVKTKDILYVQKQLGHKNLQNTLRYVGLIDSFSQEYVVRVAQDVKESSSLLESGFDFVAVIENRYVFRKPKNPLFSTKATIEFKPEYDSIIHYGG